MLIILAIVLAVHAWAALAALRLGLSPRWLWSTRLAETLCKGVLDVLLFTLPFIMLTAMWISFL